MSLIEAQCNARDHLPGGFGPPRGGRRQRGDPGPRRQLGRPRRYGCSLPATVDAPARARQWFREGPGRNLPGVPHDSAQVMVSELVTNAVRHADAGRQATITVEGQLDGRGMRIEVGDSGAGGEPTIVPSPGLHGGFGLRLVERLSDGWGWARRGGRTAVWFELATVSGG